MNVDLERIERLSEENNRLLRKLVSDLRWRQLFSLVKWVIVIGLTLGLYYYLQPIIDQIKAIYESLGIPAGALDRLFL